MKNARILISGASVAGLTLAYWLRAYGFEPTVIERANGLRPGGQAIDVRGVGLDVARQMGVLPEIQKHNTNMRGMSFVDADGAELWRSESETLTGGVIDNPDVEILRDDLCAVLYDTARRGATFRFDDSISGIEQRLDEVRVSFEHAGPETFDLVIGADGLHSNVRKLVFGPEVEFLHDLGTYIAVFTTENFLGLDHWQVFYRTQDAMAGLYSARDNTEARAILGFVSEALEYDYRDAGQHREILQDYFGGHGWETPRLLTEMWKAPDFHFDSAGQVWMERWSDDRVTLLGDAGYCGSPLSGQGTTVAMVGAYVLAGELAAADGDHRAAFAAYEHELRPFVELNQHYGIRNAETKGGTTKEEAEQLDNAIALTDYPTRDRRRRSG